MKFPSFKKASKATTAEPKAVLPVPVEPTPLLTRLRKNLSFYSASLPDVVRIPANGSTRPDEVFRPLMDATIDDIAFAIQGVEAESRAIMRRSGALEELYEAARKRGAIGTTTIAEAFASVPEKELRK
jgi:hypothetical protein